MEWYHWVLFIAAMIAGTLAMHVPRAMTWLACLAGSFVLSVIYHRAGWPYATSFGAFTNLGICYLFLLMAKQKWEMRLMNFVQLMLVVDLLYIYGAIGDHFTFAASLEAINLAALLFIGSVGIAERLDANGVGAWGLYSRRTDLVYRALWSKRSDAYRPWWQK